MSYFRILLKFLTLIYVILANAGIQISLTFTNVLKIFKKRSMKILKKKEVLDPRIREDDVIR